MQATLFVNILHLILQVTRINLLFKQYQDRKTFGNKHDVQQTFIESFLLV